MKILSILAQKPSSTGSGIYLTEVLKSFRKMGEEQAVVYGITKEDKVPEFSGVKAYPVYYESANLPFPVLGMSDEMPYRSTRYKDLTEEMLEAFRFAFLKRVREAVLEFQPDLVLCHHLYLLTALVREAFPGLTIYGFCHNTDLRQMEKHGLKREFIRENIRKLDRIFTPKEAQKKEVIRVYGVEPDKIRNIAIGYNAERFKLPKEDIIYREGIPRRRTVCLPNGEVLEKGEALDLLFAGKLGEKKGVFSLLRAVESFFQEEKGKRSLRLFLAGDNGNLTEKEAVYRLAESCSYPIHFLGRLEQEELVKFYQFSDIFTLPSFFDAVPLTVLEALACGNKVVLTALEGLEDFFKENTPASPVFFVQLPKMQNQDEMKKEDMAAFETKLKESIRKATEYTYENMVSISFLSWDAICKNILDCKD